MKRNYPEYEVFLAYATLDRSVAEFVKIALANVGLRVFDPANLEVGESIAEAIWHALAVSDSVVAILPQVGASKPNFNAELGAAMAWSKPVYLISQTSGQEVMPTFLSRFKIYPLSLIDDVANSIRKGPKPLSGKAIETLKNAYLKLQTPTDQFLKNPQLLDKLAEQFNAHAETKVPGERLLYEMVRLRKQGLWPRLGRVNSDKA